MKKMLRTGYGESFIRRILLCGFLSFLVLQGGSILAEESKDEGVKKIPSLQEVLQIVSQRYQSANSNQNNLSAETEYEVKQYYYRILFKKEQLKVEEEVHGHFEKAVTKAEEKYETGDDDISQSSITKLKLGLAGTDNGIVSLKSDIELAKISLGKMMGWDITNETPIAEETIRAVEFPFAGFEAYMQGRKTGDTPNKASDEKKFALQKAFILVNKTREKMKLARKIKKITRALLVTEVANYDFGIGDSKELFEALIIYTRVRKGLYETIYNFNMAVAYLSKTENLPSSP